MASIHDLPVAAMEDALNNFIERHCITCEHFYPTENRCSIMDITECYDSVLEKETEDIKETRRKLKENSKEDTSLGNCPRCKVPLSNIVTGRMPIEIEIYIKNEDNPLGTLFEWTKLCESCVEQIELLMWDRNLFALNGTKYEITKKTSLVEIRETS